MDRLIELHREHQIGEIPPEVEAAWLHHRFTQIHPFQDGNGRIARCLASLVFIQARWFPLVLTRDDRPTYISALEDADKGDLSNLINLFAKRFQASIVAISTSAKLIKHTEQTRCLFYGQIGNKFM